METRIAPPHSPRTREPQYQFEVDMALRDGPRPARHHEQPALARRPARLLFILSRYKFVAKMLSGKGRGRGDRLRRRVRHALVQQEVGAVTATDFDPVFIDDARRRMEADGWACETLVHDILTGPVPPGGFDAAYSLDVFEHILPEQRGPVRREHRPIADAARGRRSSARRRSSRRRTPRRGARPGT